MTFVKLNLEIYLVLKLINQKLKEKYYDLTRRRKNISPHKKSQSLPHPNFCVKKMVRPLLSYFEDTVFNCVIKDFSRRNFGIYRNADCMFILGGEKESEVDSTEGDVCDDVICVTATSSKKHESMKLPIPMEVYG
jgi:hypothetical protein